MKTKPASTQETRNDAYYLKGTANCHIVHSQPAKILSFSLAILETCEMVAVLHAKF